MLNSNQLQTLNDKALNDHKFRALAKKDGRAALESLGVKLSAAVKISVLANTPSALHVVLPVKGDVSSFDPDVAKVFQKAWADPKFKAQLLKSPAEAIKSATGAKLPKNVTITVHEDAQDSLHFVLPYVPPASGELSDADLELVAGGKAMPGPGGLPGGPAFPSSSPSTPSSSACGRPLNPMGGFTGSNSLMLSGPVSVSK
jgi:hypothetical protein